MYPQDRGPDDPGSLFWRLFPWAFAGAMTGLAAVVGIGLRAAADALK